MNLSRSLPIAAFGLLALAACGGSDLEGHTRIDAPAGEPAVVASTATVAPTAPPEPAPTASTVPPTTAGPTTTQPAPTTTAVPGLSRDTQMALMSCADALVNAPTSAMLGNPYDLSSCDNAEDLMTLDGDPARVSECKFLVNKMLVQITIDGTVGPGSDRKVQGLFHCQDDLVELATSA